MRPWGAEKPEGPRRGRWSLDEVERFKELWGLKDEATISREMGRSVAALRKLAKQVFDDPPRSGPWSEDEVARLRRYLGASNHETIARIIARPVHDLRAKVAELAVQVTDEPLTTDERFELKRLYGTRSDEDLAVVFGRRLEVIQQVASELCLSKDKAYLRRLSGGRKTTRMPRWSSEELERLKEIYPSEPNLEIARQLGRSVKSVVSKAHHLGLKKDPARLQEMGRQNVAARQDRQPSDSPDDADFDEHGERREADAGSDPATSREARREGQPRKGGDDQKGRDARSGGAASG